MRIKNTNRILLSLFLISILIISVPMDALASTNTINIGFEGVGVSIPYFYNSSSLSLFTHDRNSSTWATSGTTSRTGSRNFFGQDGAHGRSFWINLSYPSDVYLTSFSFWMDVTTVVSGNTIEFILYNQTYQASKFYASPGYGKGITSSIGLYSMYAFSVTHSGAVWNCWVFNSAGTGQLTSTQSCNAVYKYYKASITDTIGDGTMQNATTSWNILTTNSSAVTSNLRIDRIFVKNAYQYGNEGTHLDDMSFTFSSSYSGLEGVGCLDVTGLTQVGHFGNCEGDVPTPHIYKTYNIPVTTTIKAVELKVSSAQYDDDPSISNYACSINGLSIGTPVCFNQESYYYVLQWTCNYTVNNEYPTFDFYHSIQTGTRYWNVGISCNSIDDLDGDGVVSFSYTDYTLSYEWKWIGILPFYVPIHGSYTYDRNADLSMRFWTTGFPSQETYNYSDVLGLSGYTFENSTGYVYNLTRGYTTVMGGYTLSTPALAYTIRVFRNGTEIYEYGFPLDCVYPGSSFGFSPTQQGRYYIRLYTTVYRKNVTAWVVGTLPDYLISTSPTVSNQYDRYMVNYRYYHPQGYTGAIAMDLDKSILNKYASTLYHVSPIANNQSNFFVYNSDSSNAEYWGLYVNANSVYTKVTDATHYIRIPSIHENDIYPYPTNNLEITGNNENNAQMILKGTHIFPGANIDVYVNGVWIKSVGDSQYFQAPYTPTHAGVFHATLVWHANNTDVELDSCDFTVSTPETSPTKPMIDTSFIPKDMYPYIAIGLIVAFMFMPLFFIYSMNQVMSKYNTKVEIPTLTMTVMSVSMAIVGFILDIIFGLLEWWTVFVFIFILLLVFLILWIQRKTG